MSGGVTAGRLLYRLTATWNAGGMGGGYTASMDLRVTKNSSAEKTVNTISMVAALIIKKYVTGFKKTALSATTGLMKRPQHMC